MAPAGWYPDPSGRHQLRWWTGSVWSDHVSGGDRLGIGPMPPAPARPRSPWLVVGVGLGVAAAIILGVVLVTVSFARVGGVSRNVHRGAGLTISPAPPSERPGPATLSVGQALDPVITPDQGQTVVDTIWRLRAEAIQTRNVELLRQIETGPALEADVQMTQCTWCPVPPAENVTKTSIAVPRQAAYPARIWAQILLARHGKRSTDALVVLTRASAQDTWRVALEMELKPATDYPPIAQPDDEGFDIVPLPAQPPEALFAALAAYWQHWKDAGAAPPASPFGKSDVTTGKGEELAVHPQDREQGIGLLGHYRYWFDRRDPIYSFGIGDKHVACFVVQHSVHLTSRDRHGGPYQDRARKNWGRELAPGIYPALNEHHTEQTCIVSSPEEPNGVFAIGDNNVVTAEFPDDR